MSTINLVTSRTVAKFILETFLREDFQFWWATLKGRSVVSGCPLSSQRPQLCLWGSQRRPHPPQRPSKTSIPSESEQKVKSVIFWMESGAASGGEVPPSAPVFVPLFSLWPPQTHKTCLPPSSSPLHPPLHHLFLPPVNPVKDGGFSFWLQRRIYMLTAGWLSSWLEV